MHNPFFYAHACLDLIKRFVGESWLRHEWGKFEKHYRTKPKSRAGRQIIEQPLLCHPLANLLHFAHKDLEALRIGAGFQSNLNEACEISKIVRVLSDASVSGLEGRRRDLISRNYGLFEKTLFEMSAAASFVTSGRHVEFINTETGRKTPDILVDGLRGGM
jgi:hypothetical protein